MKLSSWLSKGSISLLAMSAVFAVGQETTPPADSQKGTEPEEEIIPVKWSKVTFGYTSIKPHAGLSRYARPTEGLSLHELDLFTPGGESWPYGRLILRGVPDQDNYIDGYVVLNHGKTVVRGSRKRHSFYSGDWRPVDPSEDNETDITLDHAFTPKIGGFVRYASNERDGRFPAPRDGEHTRTKTFSGGVQGDVLGGNLGVTFTSRRTHNDTNVQPETLQRGIEASYARDFGSLSLEGAAGYTRLEQAGLSAAGVRSYALNGHLQLGPASMLQFQLGRQDLDLNNVRNAYDQKRLTSSARLVHRFAGGWSFQFGFKHKEVERVRANQTFVDVPKLNEYDARLAGRIGQARLTLKGSWQDLRETAAFTTLDNRQLMWDDRAVFQAKVDGGNDVFSAYGTYTYKFQQNKAREMEIRWNSFAMGGSLVINDAFNGYAEFSADDYRVTGGAEARSLDFFFPSSRSASVGLNWAKDSTFSASANLNYYESADVRGTQLTFSLRRRMAADHDLELVIAPWRHEDRLFNITGYRTTFLMAKYTVRF